MKSNEFPLDMILILNRGNLQQSFKIHRNYQDVDLASGWLLNESRLSVELIP